MSSGSGGALNRFRVSSVTHPTDNNQKHEEQESQQKQHQQQQRQQHLFQLNAQLHSNIPLSSTGIISYI
ncbi:hypothetical protein WUBG_09440 [Wuchereria bancrofti]|uniref:Uncharacterized protein n=1 Tax=Wuchereria bancrofti TaxID=6293 RepID=J9AYJ0_WUCBA|nr:hypothetical protein WUBG_09440 [Wuchereria bancrofti]